MSIGYANGRYVQLDEAVIPIDERGHQFGDGVYEVIRAYNGKPFMLDQHIQRLINSAKAIRLPIDRDENGYKSPVLEAIHKSKLKDCDIYLQITRGIAARKHLFPDAPVSTTMTVKPMRVIGNNVREDGVKAILHEDERWKNCYIKSLNLLPNILAKQAAHDVGCFEAIMVRDGNVSEGTSSNVYIVNDNAIYTTPLSKQILPGITRMAVNEISHSLGIDFVERYFTPEEMLEADEVFITSTTSEVLSISNLDGKKIGNGKAGKVALKIFEKFMENVSM